MDSDEPSPHSDFPRSSKKPSNVRERLMKVLPPEGIEVVWVDDEDEAFVLPGRGRCGGG
jgi:hypothetical protein